MKTTQLKKCSKCGGKVCFRSEAAAQKRVNRYEDIQRVYYCEHSDSYHITSMNDILAFSYGLVQIDDGDPSDMNQVEKRLNELKKKL